MAAASVWLVSGCSRTAAERTADSAGSTPEYSAARPVAGDDFTDSLALLDSLAAEARFAGAASSEAREVLRRGVPGRPLAAVAESVPRVDAP